MSTTPSGKKNSAAASGGSALKNKAQKSPKEKKGAPDRVAPETSGKVAKKKRNDGAVAVAEAVALAAAAAAEAAAAEEEEEEEEGQADIAPLTQDDIARNERARASALKRRKKVRAKKLATQFIQKKFVPTVRAQRSNTRMVIRAAPFDRLFRAALHEVNKDNATMRSAYGTKSVSQVGKGTVAVVQRVIEDDLTSLMEAAGEILRSVQRKKVTENVLRTALAVQRKIGASRFEE